MSLCIAAKADCKFYELVLKAETDSGKTQTDGNQKDASEQCAPHSVSPHTGLL